VHGKPLLIRDLPVFREVAGNAATYFRAATPGQFVEELADWLTPLTASTATQSKGIAVQTWAQSAKQLLRHTIHNPFDRSSC